MSAITRKVHIQNINETLKDLDIVADARWIPHPIQHDANVLRVIFESKTDLNLFRVTYTGPFGAKSLVI